MPRVTLYVPDDLKTLMTEFGDGLNWSAVCQDAFRDAITTYEVKKEKDEVERVSLHLYCV